MLLPTLGMARCARTTWGIPSHIPLRGTNALNTHRSSTHQLTDTADTQTQDSTLALQLKTALHTTAQGPALDKVCNHISHINHINRINRIIKRWPCAIESTIAQAAIIAAPAATVLAQTVITATLATEMSMEAATAWKVIGL